MRRLKISIKKVAISTICLFSIFFMCSSFTEAQGEKMDFNEISITCGHAEYLNPIYVVRNSAELNSMLEGANKQNQPSCVASGIDFEKFTLIGSSMVCYGSETPEVIKSLFLNKEEKKIYYNVDIYEKGNIQSQKQTVAYWILIPKIDKNIDVISQINFHKISEE